MINPHDLLNTLDAAKEAQATWKSTLNYLQEFRKSKKAILINMKATGTVQEKESFAYSHPEYMKLLEDIREAEFNYEKARLNEKIIFAKIDVWRTEEANNRYQGTV